MAAPAMNPTSVALDRKSMINPSLKLKKKKKTILDIYILHLPKVLLIFVQFHCIYKNNKKIHKIIAMYN